MFGSNEQEEINTNVTQQQPEDTMIGSTIKIEGDLVSNGNIIVEGEVVGSLKTEKTLTVGSSAKVNADVKALNAEISGEVNGNLSVSEKIVLHESARVVGDVQAKIVVIQPGATFNGKCTMDENGPVMTDSVKEEEKKDEEEESSDEE